MKQGVLFGALAVLLAFTLPATPKAATIEYSFFGTLDIPLVDFQGINAPAGTRFSGVFSYDENALAVEGGVYSRGYEGLGLLVQLDGVAAPVLDVRPQINVNPYGDVLVVFAANLSAQSDALRGSLNIFDSLTPQVTNPLVLLPDDDDLETFALAGLSFGTVGGGAFAFSNEFQGTVDRIVATPLPAAAWLFLSAVAGLAVLRSRRQRQPATA